MIRKYNKKRLMAGLLSAILLITNIMSKEIQAFATEQGLDILTIEGGDEENNSESMTESKNITKDDEAFNDGKFDENKIDDKEENKESKDDEDSKIEPDAEEEGETEKTETDIKNTENESENIETKQEGDTLDDMEEVEADEVISEEDAELVSPISSIVNGEYEDIIWSIDTNGELLIEGTGNFSTNTDRAQWLDYKDLILSAKVKVTGMTNASHMFEGCGNLISVDFSEFDTSNISSINSMFKDCSSLIDLDLSGFNTSNVYQVYSMFEGCSSLTSLDLSGFDTSKMNNMRSMFEGCSSLVSLNLGEFNNRNVTEMSYMFKDCKSLTNLDLEKFSTDKVTRMNNMFDGCSSLTSLDIQGFDTRNVKDMFCMFRNCNSLTSVYLNGIDTSNVTEMGEMFSGCGSLDELNLNGIDTSSVRNMSRMFQNCSNLKELDLSGFNTVNLEDSVGGMGFMFSGCSNLKSLDLSGFDMGNLTSNSTPTTRIFYECNSLTKINAPYNITVSVDLPGEIDDIWYLADGITVTKLPQNLMHSVVVGKNYIPEEEGSEIGGETSDEIEIVSNIAVPKDKSVVGIIDRKTGKPVVGARVWVNGEYWTDENGIIELDNTGLTTIQIEKEGYISKTTKKYLEKGKGRTIFLIPDTGEVEIMFATLRLTGEDENIMDDIVYLKSGDLEEWEGTAAAFILTVESAGKAKKYQLIQDGKVLQESTTGAFNLPGKYINNSDGSVSCYVDSFSAGHRVFARVFDEQNRYKTQELGIRISEESSVTLKIKELGGNGKVSLGDRINVTIPSSVPIMGGAELDFGFENALPITIDINNSGKVKIALNKSIPKNGEEWQKFKQEYRNQAMKAINASDAGAAFGSNPEPFGAGMFSLDGNIMGYGEGYLDESSDSLCVDVGVIVSVKGEAKYTQYIFIATIPIYLTMGGGASLIASGEVNIALNDSSFYVNGGTLEFEPSIYAILEGGVGGDGILSLGAYGKFNLSGLHRFTNHYTRITLNGNAKIKATALLWSKVLAEADLFDFVLYDSNRRSTTYAARSNVYTASWQDMSDAELISMDYLSKRAENSGISAFTLNRSYNFGSTRFMSYAYENASPRLVKVGSKLYLFYLDGVEGRSAQNQTALFYQSSTDNGTTWTDAVRVDNKANETADYDFDVAVNGNNIYVIWSDAGKVYGNEILSMDSEKAIATVGKEMDLMLTVINSNTGAIKTSSIATEDADMKPHVAVDNDGSVYVAWITNDVASADGLLSNENQMGICYASSTDNYAVHSIPLAKGYYPQTLDVGTVGAETCIAIDIDIDGNLDTQEDREIYTLNLNGGDNLISQTSNDIVDSVPLFGEIGGKSCLFWYQGGNIAYTADKQNIDFVFGDSNIPPMGQEFSLMAGNSGNASIVWAATSVEDAGVDLYCTDFDGNGWSNAYKLDEMESEYTAPVSGYLDGSDYRMAYLGSTYEGSELYSHIYLCTPEERIDTSVTLSAERDGVQGEEYPLHLTVTNNGNVPVKSLVISSADGSIQETITGLSIAPGAVYDFMWSGIMLPSEMSEIYTCKLAVKAPGETDIDSNVFDLTVGEPDFSIDTYLDYSNGDQFAGAVVSNKGILSSDVVLTIYKDENHTSQIYQTTLSEIGGGESKLAIFDLTALDKKLPAFYFTIADMNGREIYTGDNEAVLYSGKGTYLEDNSSGDGNNKPTPSPTVEPTAKPTDAPTAKPTVQPATPTPGRPVSGGFPFHDVAVVPGNWKYESVKYVYENGIMNGITNPDGTIDSFQPDGSLTRAMFATVLYRMAGQPPVAYENRFSDVSTGRYYSSAIIWAYKNGIVNGYADGSYGVDDYITREQIAKMLRIYAQVRGYSTDDRADLSRFPDISEVSGWAMDHMSWAVGCGMVNGKNINGTYYLDAKGNATRAECAAMLTRFINRYGK